MARPACALPVFAALALAACGGPSKEAEEPRSSGSVHTEDRPESPEDMDPAGSDLEGDRPGDGGDGSGSAGEDGTPGIKPPGLDLTPAEKRRRVSKHVKRARAALSGRSKDPDRAVEAARAALEVDETSAEAMILLAQANYEKGYLDLAEDILDKATDRGGSDQRELHFLYGIIYERTERKDEALAAYERAIAIDPSYRSALLNLGVHYLRKKQYPKAIDVYEKLTGQLGVNSAKAWNNLGAAYRGRSADFAATDVERRNELLLRAETTFKRAIAVDRDYGPAYYNLGLTYLDADPFPTPEGDMDRLKRLKRAKTYFDEYRRKPGADDERADKQANLAQTLYDEEEEQREKIRKAEERRKKMEEAMEDMDDDEGWE